MARITLRTPSTAKALRVIREDVSTTFETIVEAPDFSVPDASESFSFRDPTDSSRAIRPGEIFFLSPISARNKSASAATLFVQYVTEDGFTINFGEMEIPAGDTGFIPLQGRSMFKRDLAGTTGDQLQVRASAANTFDIWVSAEEKASNEHTGVIE